VLGRRPEGAGRTLSNGVGAKWERHRAYGGVVPEIAARGHVECLDEIVAQALREAGTSLGSLDAVAVTAGVVGRVELQGQDQTRFERWRERVQAAIAARFQATAEALYGGRSFVDVQTRLSQAEWQAYSQSVSRFFDRGVICGRRRGAVGLPSLVGERGEAGIQASRHYGPWWREAEDDLAGQVNLTLPDGLYLLPPGSVTTGRTTPRRCRGRSSIWPKHVVGRTPSRRRRSRIRPSSPRWPTRSARSRTSGRRRPSIGTRCS